MTVVGVLWEAGARCPGTAVGVRTARTLVVSSQDVEGTRHDRGEVLPVRPTPLQGTQSVIVARSTPRRPADADGVN